MADTIQTAIYRLSYQLGDGIQQLNAAQRATDGVVQSAERLAVAEEKVTRATRTSSDEVSRTVARLDKRVAAEQQLQRELARVARWQQEGIGSQREQAQVIDLATARYQRQVQALTTLGTHMDKTTTSGGLMRHEMINLSRQVQDIGVSLSGGQSPFRVLVEQGTQVADIFASSQATMGGFFGQVVSGVGRVLTPMRLLAGGMLGVGAAAVTAAMNWGTARHEVEMALLGIGRASGATVGEIEKIANSSSSLFGLSISEAREFGSALAATGKIGVEQISDLVGLGKNLALVLGVDSTKAAEMLGKALSDPGKGVEELNQRLGAFDAATIRLVQNLTAQNRIMEAQKVITEGVKNATADAGQAASTSANFWTALGNTISNVWDKIGEGAARVTGIGLKLGLDEQITSVKNEIEILEKVLASRGGRAPGLGTARRLEAERAELERLIAAQERYNEAIARAQRFRDSQPAAAAVRDMSPEIAQMELLENRARGLAAVMEKVRQEFEATGRSEFLKNMGVSMEQLALAANRSKNALATALTPAQRLTAEFELQVAAIQARTQSERLMVAERQAELALAGQTTSAEEYILAVERARYVEITKIATAHRDAMASLEDQLRVAQAVTRQEILRAQEIATTNELIRQGRSQMQAEEEAAMQRRVAEARDEVEAKKRAAEETKKQRQEEERLAEAARRAAEAMWQQAVAAAQAQLETGKAARNTLELEAKLALIGHTSWDTGGIPIMASRVGGSISQISAALAGFRMNIQNNVANIGASSLNKTISDIMEGLKGITDPKAALEKAAKAQEEAAQAAQNAARAQESAAAAAERAFREAIERNTAFVNENVAGLLLKGISAREINRRIEAGDLSLRGADPEATFKTQIDLYKRAGLSDAQIAADIRAGIIGEGVSNTALLQALDSLTDAVESNTAAQIGLSEFYTQQGDRLLGYRGYSVQNGMLSSPTAPSSSISQTVPGMDGVVNQVPPYATPSPINAPSSPSPISLPVTTNPKTVVSLIENLDGSTTIKYSDGTTYTIPAGTGPNPTWGKTPIAMPGTIAPHYFAEGGIADRPTLGVFGETGPEAFVPLRGGAIPVRISGNDTGTALPAMLQSLFAILAQRFNDNEKPRVQINAPLIEFKGEPTRDDVRESAFQSAQMLRRLVSAA